MAVAQVAMKSDSTAPGRPSLGRGRAALTWCLCALWCTPVSGGKFLLHRQPASTGAVATSAVATTNTAGTNVSQHIMLNLFKLHQEALNAVAQQSNVIQTKALRKEALAKDAIELEIPLAAEGDTQELAKDVGEEDKQIQAALQKSTDEAKEGLEELKDKTAIAVNMSAARTVRDVEIQAEQGAMNISEHSVQLQAEAAALAREAVGAANFSQEAAINSKLWVNELPSKEAAGAVAAALQSEAESKLLRHEYEDIKRIAKLAGNLALTTIKVSDQALAQAEVAKKEATLTVEQAAQNALLLNTIRSQTKQAANTATLVVDALQPR